MLHLPEGVTDAVSCLLALLEGVGKDLEPRLRTQLDGLFGAMVRAYLPQTWVFRTEGESVVLSVDREGHLHVSNGGADAPDVTIETSHDRLAAALRTRSRDRIPPGPFRAVPHTEKGRTAYAFLRQRLGL